MKRHRATKRKGKGDVAGKTVPPKLVMIPGASGRVTYSSPELAALFAPLERALLRERELEAA